MAWRARVGLAAALLLLLPSALALPGEGRLTTYGPTEFPAASSIEGVPLGIFSDDLDGVANLVLVAPRAHLYQMTERYTVLYEGAPSDVRVAPPLERSEQALTDVRLEMVGKGERGWVGIYPRGATSTAVLTASAQATITPAGTSHIGNERAEGPLDDAVSRAPPFQEEGDPAYRQYQQTITVPHLIVDAPGTLGFEGSGALKVLGLDMALSSNELDAVLQTGFNSRQDTFREDEIRWFVLVFEDGAIEVLGQGSLDMALSAAHASWTGAATFAGIRGEFRTAEVAYATGASGGVINGEFQGSLVPEQETDRVVARLVLEGDLASTTLQPQGTFVSPARGASADLPWLSLFLFGAVVVAGSAGATVLVTRRRRAVAALAVAAPAAPGLVGPYDGLHADDFMRLADEAAVERRWARALQWAQRARDLAPANARIRADEGEYLFQLGLFEEALQAFAEASRLDGEEGYADYRGAQAAAAAGRPVDEVLAWLERALARSPDLVGDLELFKEFDTMRGLPAYDAMVREAYARLGIDPAFP